MTISKTLTIWCEGVDREGFRCHQWTTGMGAMPRAADLRTYAAKQEGWVRRDGRDYCCKAHAENAARAAS